MGMGVDWGESFLCTDFFLKPTCLQHLFSEAQALHEFLSVHVSSFAANV